MDRIVLLVISVVSVFVLTALLVRKFVKVAIRYAFLDIPNARSSHTVAVARGAGIVVASMSILVALVLYKLQMIPFVLWSSVMLAYMLAVVGFCDDVIGLSPLLRIALQAATALFASYLILQAEFSWWYVAGISFYICWSTNLFNFMDGIDGLAASEAIFMLLIAAWLFYTHQGQTVAIFVLLVSSIVAGFLCFNWPRAVVFMGDAGSTFLGFLLGIIVIIGQLWFNISWESWVIAYGSFLFDATATLCRRIAKKQKVYQAHRSHAYQRLQLLGWEHKKIVCSFIGVNALLGGLAIVASDHEMWRKECLWIACSILAILYALIERKAPMYNS